MWPLAVLINGLTALQICLDDFDDSSRNSDSGVSIMLGQH